MLRFLVEERGSDVLEQEDADGWTAAHSAVRGGHVAVLRYIIEELGAAEVLRRPPFRPTLERIAAKYNNREMLKFLVEQAALIEYELFSAMENGRGDDAKTDCDVSSEVSYCGP